MVKISIVVPIYKVERYIENCMISICNQTFTEFEVILVNDGTPDSSVSKAENILSNNQIVYTTINQINQGVSTARNNGIKFSKGEWIVCIDSDDVITNNFLEQLYKAVKKDNTNVSIVSYKNVIDNIFQEPESLENSIIIEKQVILDKFLKRSIKIISPAILINREYLIKNRLFYNESMIFSEDVNWIWKVLLSTDKISYNESELYNYLNRPNSTMTSSDLPKILNGYEEFIKFEKQLSTEKNDLIKKYLLNRWVFGALKASCKMLSYEDFNSLSRKISANRHFMGLKTFPDLRVKVLSGLFLLNKKMFYLICKNIL